MRSTPIASIVTVTVTSSYLTDALATVLITFSTSITANPVTTFENMLSAEPLITTAPTSFETLCTYIPAVTPTRFTMYSTT